MNKVKVTELRKYLKQKTDKELIDEIVELFKVNRQVQEIYSIKVNPDKEELLLEEYKNKIIQQFFPDWGKDVLNYKVLKQLVSDFEKVAVKKISVIELLLYYVESGVEFTNSYGDIDAKFYNNIARIYEKALKTIVKNNYEKKYYMQCLAIMKDSEHIGWGFGDWMYELFCDYLSHMVDEFEGGLTKNI